MKHMKQSILPILAAINASLVLGGLVATAQPQRGAEKLTHQTILPDGAAERALTQALAGPDGEYAAHAEYAAIIQKFGQVQPYASIIRSEECHIAALKRHFEMRGMALPEDPYAGSAQPPATLKEAAQAGVAAEERNVAMYEELLAQAKGQPDLERVFTHLQWASREHHLPAFKAAVANGGQLQPGEFMCGMGGGQGRGGPPAWAGGRGCGYGQAGCCGACGLAMSSQGAGDEKTGFRRGKRAGRRFGRP
jgi:hypothetical protein